MTYIFSVTVMGDRMATQPLHIVAADSYRVNPGDLSWASIERFGDIEVYPRYDQRHLSSYAATAQALLIDRVTCDGAFLDRFTRLRYVGLFATGHDTIDLSAADERGIVVTNVPAYSAPSVAQAAISLLLSLLHKTAHYNDEVHDRHWLRDLPFQYSRPLVEAEGLQLGIVGFGAIGSRVARIAAALGMRIAGNAARKKPLEGVDVTWLPWDTLLSTSDVISLHVPLTDTTRRMIGPQEIAMMRPGSFLVNTSRGGLIDDYAVAKGLQDHHLAGVGLDVLGDVEPPHPTNPLLDAPNCVITPHIGWATRSARTRCMAEVAKNLESYVNGGDRNRLV